VANTLSKKGKPVLVELDRSTIEKSELKVRPGPSRKILDELANPAALGTCPGILPTYIGLPVRLVNRYKIVSSVRPCRLFPVGQRTVRDRCKNMQFLLAFTFGVLAVRLRKMPKRFKRFLNYTGKAWYSVRLGRNATRSTYRFVKFLVGLSKTSPRNVLTVWGASFTSITRNTPFYLALTARSPILKYLVSEDKNREMAFQAISFMKDYWESHCIIQRALSSG
jgi:hypothetical protein